MSLIFTRAIRDEDDALIDADSTPTIGVIRTDTSAVIAAPSTAMTHDSTGRYSYTIASPVAGVTYRATYSIIVGGRTITSSSDKTYGAATAWYYADQSAVTDLIGTEALRVISNEPGASSSDAVDSARVLRAGQDTDAVMNMRLKRMFTVVPLENMDDDTTRILKRVSAGLVVQDLNSRRMLLTPMPKNLTEIDRRVLRAIDDTKTLWSGICRGLIELVADNRWSRGPFAQSVVPTASDLLATRQALALRGE